MSSAAPRPDLSRRYLLYLSLASAVMLVGGNAIRRWLAPHNDPTPAPPSEAAALRQLSREAVIQRSATFLSERIDAVAPLVQWDSASSASALRWNGDTVLTTAATRTLVNRQQPDGDATRTPSMYRTESLGREWALVIARRPDGRVVSSSGIAGGVVSGRCKGVEVREYLLGAPLHSALAGGGIFDLDGRLSGMVVRCGSQLVPIPTSEVPRLLALSAANGAAASPFGVRFAALDDASRRYFGADSGLVVSELVAQGRAARGGLRVGDIVTAVNDVPVGRASRLGALVPDSVAADTDTLRLTIRRSKQRLTIVLAPAGVNEDSTSRASLAPLGIRLSNDDAEQRGVAIARVDEGSAAARAGLRASDRLVRVGDSTVATLQAARRFLERAQERALWLVVERDGVQLGLLTSP